ncbi:glutamate racemase [Rodentibacter caecimuris]|uniref:Glutamate racemase n=1 Tax=Rodentibacter caecimuris TaxID=1796644 RepID=A0ABX3L1J8_9PAST|nr:glutamate racemase [Rodentibacter heylii]
MKNKQPTLLFFDSGIGGFSVYNEVKKVSPNCHYLYCFDNGGFPYSEKSEDVIIERTLKICQNIDHIYSLDLIVIACNTASTVVLPTLRQHFNIPIVGTVPAIKPAAEISRTKHIGLLATKGTVKRNYVDDLIIRYAQDCKVEKLGTTLLVEMAEQKLQGKNINITVLSQELSAWQSLDKLDTVILGCTHFPLLKDEIQSCLPQVKYFVDPSNGIAKRVVDLTNRINLKEGDIIAVNQAFCTEYNSDFSKQEELMRRWGFNGLQVLKLIEK